MKVFLKRFISNDGELDIVFVDEQFGHSSFTFFEEVPEVIISFVQIHFAGFNFGDVEDIIDESEQIFTSFLNV